MALKFGKVENNAEASERTYTGAIQMGIEHAPTKLIVKYITDMYSRPLAAAIRETVSNALDANMTRGLGVDDVEMSLSEEPFWKIAAGEQSDSDGDSTPDPYSSNHFASPRSTAVQHAFFSVRDKGPGMTYDKLVNVYTQYGVSDKRDDGTSTGAFGLGAKSPLAYTNEFCVLTRTEEDGTLFMRAYRTSDDDFVADMPVRIEDQVEIRSWRDGNGNLIVPLPAGSDAPAGCTEDVIEVTDLFDVDETGTIVSFAIPGPAHPAAYMETDTRTARDIMNRMGHIMAYAGDGEIVDKYREERRIDIPWLLVGERDIADDTGDTVHMRVFIPHTVGRDVSVSYFRAIGELLYGDEKLTREDVTFKVGNWLYPADGSSCPMDSNIYSTPNIIIDVPSKALSFVPSRDAIRDGGTDGNGNVDEFVEMASEMLLDYLETDDGLHEFVNYATKCSGNFVSTVRDVFHQFSVAAGIHDDMLALVGKEGQRILLDLTKLTAFGSYTVSDIRHTCRVVAGSVDTPTSTMRNAGVYDVPECDAVRLLDKSGTSLSFVLKNKDGEDEKRNIGGYERANSKVVGDGVLDVPFTSLVIAEEGESIHRSVCYSLGEFLISAIRWPGQRNIILVDASASGIRKMRLHAASFVGNLAEELEVNMNSAIYILIPPSSEGTQQPSEVIDACRKMCEAACATADKDFYFVEAEATERLAAPKNKKMESSELEKMVSNVRVLTRCFIYDEDNPEVIVGETVNGNARIRQDKKSIAKAMLEYPSQWGIIVMNEYPEDAFEVSKAALAFGIVPGYIEKIACISSRNFNAKRSSMCIESGFTVIFDGSGKSKDAIVPSDTFTIEDSDEGYITKRVAKVKPPEDYIAYRKALVRKQSHSSFQSEISNGITGTYWVNKGRDAYESGWVSVFSCGHEDTSFLDYDANVIENIESTYKGDIYRLYTVESVAEELERDEVEVEKRAADISRSLHDCARIWQFCLSNTALSLNLDKVDGKTLQILRELSVMLGVESGVDSYYKGVPIEDILA